MNLPEFLSSGFDRSRAFYPVVMIVIASYYALFALMGGSLPALALECGFIAGFVLVSVLGFKLNQAQFGRTKQYAPFAPGP